MIRFYRTLGFKVATSILALLLPASFLLAVWIASTESVTIQEMTIDKGRVAALAGAKAYAIVLEIGVNAGEITLDCLVNPTYTEIHYKVLVEHRRYHTGCDWYTDAHGIQALQDAILAAGLGLFLYASGIDRFGYVLTPHAIYDHEPTGDFVVDAKQSRQKRKYEDPVVLSSARFMGNVGQATLVQEYMRTPGGKTWDVAAPIYVKGQFFGAFRVGVRADQIEAHRWAFITQLSIWFGILSAGMILVVSGLLWLAMRPLHRLSITAHALGEWDGDLDAPYIKNPVAVESLDEIGSMAICLERIRRVLRMFQRAIDDRGPASDTQVRRSNDVTRA